MTFAERLRALRGDMPMTELADASGLERTALHRLERGERQPSWETVCKLADALDATPNDFLDCVEKERKSTKSRKSC